MDDTVKRFAGVHPDSSVPLTEIVREGVFSPAPITKCKWQNWVVMCLAWSYGSYRCDSAAFMMLVLRVDPAVLSAEPGLLLGQVREFGKWHIDNREAKVPIDPPCWVRFDC